MRVVNIHHAKTHLSRLLREVAAGESFVIARAGKPVARVVPMEHDGARKSRIGFLKGHDIRVPDDFDRMAAKEIEAMFYGED